MSAQNNDSVPTGQTVAAVRLLLAAATVALVYLARYGPEQSAIEPIWTD